MPADLRRAAALLVAAASFGVAARASAYCRTTTCDPESTGDDACVNVDGCLTGGLLLYWAPRCVSYSAQRDGSERLGISYDQLNQILGQTFGTWTSVDCGGSPPSITLLPTDPVSCDRHEYNDDAPNANLWMFRDDAWPYDDDGWTLALTTITFNVDTGEIYDADVEINSHQHVISIDDHVSGSDLASILTHEAGHVLGLAHSTDSRATMYPLYRQGSSELRSLSEDDGLGICAIYPPNRPTGPCDPKPRHGFSTECAQPEEGCGCLAAARRPGAGGAALLLLAAWLTARGRRRRRQR